VADGSVIRVRRDAYASRWMPEQARSAAIVGGRLTCVSALVQLGCFEPPSAALHVQVAPGAARLRAPDASDRRPGSAELVLHWTAVDARAADVLLPAVASAHQLLRCQTRPMCIAVLDSALQLGVLTASQLDEIVVRAPRRLRLVPADLEGRSESGIESLVRVGLRDVGLRVETQVVVPGVGRVDLLVEGRVVVEVDGRRWHHDQQERDYWRDLELARRGYVVLRVDYGLAVSRMGAIVGAVLRASSRATPVGVHDLRSLGAG
jgi:very-short-patch-repair endonuclease